MCEAKWPLLKELQHSSFAEKGLEYRSARSISMLRRNYNFVFSISPFSFSEGQAFRASFQRSWSEAVTAAGLAVNMFPRPMHTPPLPSGGPFRGEERTV